MSNLSSTFDVVLNRWREVTDLISVAKGLPVNSLAQLAVRKTALIMLCAHYEGSIKTIAQAIVDDLNENCVFRVIPTSLKIYFIRTCFRYDDEKNDKKAKTAIKLLDDTDIKMPEDLFTRKNNNPREQVVNTIAEKLGVSGLVSCFKGSKFEEVFSNDTKQSTKFLKNIESRIKQRTSAYPYKLNPKDYNLPLRASKEESLFTTFIEQFMLMRHKFVHGNEFSDVAPEIFELEDYLSKIQHLVYGFVYIVGKKIILDINSEDINNIAPDSEQEGA
jgi:hypothetical protein